MDGRGCIGANTCAPPTGFPLNPTRRPVQHDWIVQPPKGLSAASLSEMRKQKHGESNYRPGQIQIAVGGKKVSPTGDRRMFVYVRYASCSTLCNLCTAGCTTPLYPPVVILCVPFSMLFSTCSDISETHTHTQSHTHRRTGRVMVLYILTS